MKPKCHNRPPAAEGRWHDTGRVKRVYIREGWRFYIDKPILRWHPRWFEDRCATHDGVGIGPNNENYPEAKGWDCTGCRWSPNKFMGIEIVTNEFLPPNMVAVSKTTSVGKSDREINFITSTGDPDAIPNDGRRFWPVPMAEYVEKHYKLMFTETPEEKLHRDIDAFEPIWRSKQ